MYVCMYIYIYIVYVYMYVCMYVCVCIHIYVCMYTHTHTHTGNSGAEYASRRRGVIANVRFYYSLYLLYLKVQMLTPEELVCQRVRASWTALFTTHFTCFTYVSASSCVVNRSLDFRWTPSEQEVFFFLLASVSEFVREPLSTSDGLRMSRRFYYSVYVLY
jgi:hypothetical protein